MKKKRIISILMVIFVCCLFAGCANNTSESKNTKTAMKSSSEIIDNQPAPMDLSYSLERYNVIKRAYWVNGQREKAMSLPCEIEKPLGYIDDAATSYSWHKDGINNTYSKYLDNKHFLTVGLNNIASTIVNIVTNAKDEEVANTNTEISW